MLNTVTNLARSHFNARLMCLSHFNLALIISDSNYSPVNDRRRIKRPSLICLSCSPLDGVIRRAAQVAFVFVTIALIGTPRRAYGFCKPITGEIIAEILRWGPPLRTRVFPLGSLRELLAGGRCSL